MRDQPERLSRKALGMARQIVSLARTRDISFLAGGIAFFAFLSLIPAMVLVLAIGSLVGGEQFAQQVVSLVEEYLSPEGSQIVGEALAGTRGLAGLSALSGLVLLWSALKVFRAIDVAFGRIYGKESSSSLTERLRIASVVSVAIACGVVLLLLVQMALTRTVGLAVVQSFSWPLTVAGLVVILFPVFYILPPVRRPAWLVLPGTTVAVAGLLLLQQLFRFYVAAANQYQAYGVVGAVLLFLLWLYFGALILIFGAIVNAVVGKAADASGDSGEKQSDAPPDAID